MASELLTEEELAKRWRVSTETLRYWRWNGTGPDYIKLNGRILYYRDDIEQFEKARLRRHTANEVLINGKEGKVDRK